MTFAQWLFDPAEPRLAYLLLAVGVFAMSIVVLIAERRRAGEPVRRRDREDGAR